MLLDIEEKKTPEHHAHNAVGPAEANQVGPEKTICLFNSLCLSVSLTVFVFGPGYLKGEIDRREYGGARIIRRGGSKIVGTPSYSRIGSNFVFFQGHGGFMNVVLEAEFLCRSCLF